MTLLPQASVSSDADLVPVVPTIPPSRHPTNDNSNPQQGSGMVPESSSVGPLGPSVSSASLRSFSTKIPPTHRDSRKLFVGGLPADVTDQEFREFFEQFGAVMDSVVMFDRDTHRSRGFGFVTFEDPAVCHRLLEMNDSGEGVGRLVMRGKTCEVKAAQPKESSMRGMAKYGRHSNMAGRPRGGGGPVHTKPFPPHNSVQPTSFPPPSDPNLGAQGHVVGTFPYMQDPSMHTSMMYAADHYGHYNGGSVYYPNVASYMAPMYYPHASHGTVASYDPSSYLNGSHQHNTDVMENISSRGLVHQPTVPLQHSISQQSSFAYVPYNMPAPFVGYPSSVMQPLAPGIPARLEDSIVAADTVSFNAQQNRE